MHSLKHASSTIKLSQFHDLNHKAQKRLTVVNHFNSLLCKYAVKVALLINFDIFAFYLNYTLPPFTLKCLKHNEPTAIPQWQKSYNLYHKDNCAHSYILIDKNPKHSVIKRCMKDPSCIFSKN